MRFWSSELSSNFKNECIKRNCWYSTSWEDTFRSMGFKTYALFPEIIDSEGEAEPPHYLSDIEYNWLILKYR